MRPVDNESGSARAASHVAESQPSLEARTSQSSWDEAVGSGHHAESGTAEGLTHNPWTATSDTHDPGTSGQPTGAHSAPSTDRFDHAEAMEEGRTGASQQNPAEANAIDERPGRRTWGQFFADHAKQGDNFDKTMKPVTVPLQAMGLVTGVGYVAYKLTKGEGL